jgi:hypothetical protein
MFFAAGLLLTLTTVFAEKAPYPAQMTVNVYQYPSAVVAMNKAYLQYEMYVTSFMTMPVTLTSLEVKDSNNTIYTTHYDKKDFVFKPKESKIIYVSIPFNALNDVPDRLINQLTFNGKIKDRKINFPLITPALTVDKTPPVIVSTPLRGSNWLAVNGLSNTSLHRKAALYFGGRPYYPEIYAIDFLQMGKDGKTYKGDRHDNKSYHCYNQDILAVAEGRVALVQDGIPENVPNSNTLAVPMTEKTLPGNYVVLDLGNNTFAAYGHLIPGSIKVKVGDRVTRGQVLAKLGNSGNSGEPHLHIQITDKPEFLQSNAKPYGYDRFKVIPSNMASTEPGNSKEFINQLPLEDTMMEFD